MAHEDLLGDVERFLADTRMGSTYFGQKAVGNSKLVRRMREGRPIETGTADRIRSFMEVEVERRRAELERLSAGLPNRSPEATCRAAGLSSHRTGRAA